MTVITAKHGLGYSGIRAPAPLPCLLSVCFISVVLCRGGVRSGIRASFVKAGFGASHEKSLSCLCRLEGATGLRGDDPILRLAPSEIPEPSEQRIGHLSEGSHSRGHQCQLPKYAAVPSCISTRAKLAFKTCARRGIRGLRKWVLGQMLVAGTGVLVPTSFKAPPSSGLAFVVAFALPRAPA